MTPDQTGGDTHADDRTAGDTHADGSDSRGRPGTPTGGPDYGALAALVVALATALALVAGGVGAVAGAPAAGGTDGTAPSVAAGSGTGVAPQMDGGGSGDGNGADGGDGTDASDGGDDAFVDCVNGTSRATLACGYNPGPTAVELESQVTGDAATVRAVETPAGGFVAVHRLSFVDGAVTESLVGVSGHLDAGLHRNVRVPLDEPAGEAGTYVAVVYRDDGDGDFEFVSSGGATDRPYTVTYSAETGNVTDEAGDVIGDTARLTPAPTIGEAPAADLDGDGRFEDVNGNGRFGVLDVMALLTAQQNGEVDADVAVPAFDFDDDGRFGIGDVAALLRLL